MGRKFTAEEMREAGMVSRIFPSATFKEEVLKLATAAAKFPPQAMKDTKALIRDHDYEFLNKVNDREMTLLGERMASEESINAIIEFMSKFFFFFFFFPKSSDCRRFVFIL
jgi:peroxisomal 3,2-trans-enoyl-CoA isomerase